MKKVILIVAAVAVIGAAVYLFTRDSSDNNATNATQPVNTVVAKEYEVIGKSVKGEEIRAYKFGSGGKKLVFVGAIHGGYEWNSALLAYELIKYLKANPTSIPAEVSVSVIPVANPDGLKSVVGTSETFNIESAPKFNFADEVKIGDPVVNGRFNANGVDLNRNFDCKWKPKATWRTYTVSAGTAAFSEPESQALRDFFLADKPTAVVFFHSASNGVYTSFCNGKALPATSELLSAYSKASGYTRYDDYPYYEVTGDAADWLATQGVAAISVELKTHEVVEWEKNLAGVKAMFDLYSKK